MTARIDTEALRALRAKATQGEWIGPRITDTWPPGCLGVYALDEHGEPAEIVGFTGYADDSGNAEHDAELVVACVNALPELCSEIERLNAALAELAGEVRDLRSLVNQTPTMSAIEAER